MGEGIGSVPDCTARGMQVYIHEAAMTTCTELVPCPALPLHTLSLGSTRTHAHTAPAWLLTSPTEPHGGALVG